MSNFTKMGLKAIAGVSLFTVPMFASASGYSVQVGYADGLRGVGFFPSPWSGDPGIVFVGNPGPGLDSGALRIDNTSGGTITVDDVSVVLNGGAGPTFDLWGSNVLLAGQKLVLDQTAFYNFDTSDYGYTGCGGALDPSKAPVVTVTVGGVPTTYIDSGQVLNTNGFDYACLGNESFAWRLIGTDGTTGGTPEPGSVALLIGAGVSGVGLLLRRRRKN